MLAQYYLGEMYTEGKGVAQDYNKAMDWYQKAADGGYKHAQVRLIQLQAEREKKAKLIAAQHKREAEQKEKARAIAAKNAAAKRQLAKEKARRKAAEQAKAAKAARAAKAAEKARQEKQAESEKQRIEQTGSPSPANHGKRAASKTEEAVVAVEESATQKSSEKPAKTIGVYQFTDEENRTHFEFEY